MIISVDTIQNCKEDLERLSKAHHAEVNEFYDVPLDINWDLYFKAQNSRAYVLVVVRVDGNLVGWLGFFLSDHIRHIGYKIAKEDWYYVDLNFRGQGIGRQMFIYAESVLKKLNIKRVMLSCKVAHDHSKMFESLGYRNYEKNFTKLLD